MDISVEFLLKLSPPSPRPLINLNPYPTEVRYATCHSCEARHITVLTSDRYEGRIICRGEISLDGKFDIKMSD